MIVKAIYGDYYHPAAPYVSAMDAAIQGLDCRVANSIYPASFDRSMLAQCDVLVLCKEGVVPGAADHSVRWMTLDDEKAIERFVLDGGTLFGWHSGLASYDPEGPIHAMYGGRFFGHPPQHEFELKPVEGSESYYPSKKPYTMTDELYTMSVTSETASIWLEGRSPENGVQAVGWTRRHGRGKAVCLSLAHEIHNLHHEHTQETLRAIVAG